MNTQILKDDTKLNQPLEKSSVLFLRVAPQLHDAIKSKAKKKSKTINKFLALELQRIANQVNN
jgi:predicted HicB family RNase H-like nuclease